jgi:predicted enzyme related to lactoylglutathione lyase
MSEQQASGAVLYAKNITQVSEFYAQVAGLKITHCEADHVALASALFQLVVVAIPEDLAASIVISTPPVRRTETPIKLIIVIASIDGARSTAARLGGELDPPKLEWQYRGYRVCDGLDPEGNIVQFRERL